MNRTDRLVAMVMYLQGRRLVRAEELAEHFEISVRTVYRDVAALGEAGVPVTGEAGVGYSLVKGYHLPPVMFTTDEAMALFVGGEMVRQFTDASLTTAMGSALLKIRSVLPRERQDDLDRLARATAVHGPAPLPSGSEQRLLLPVQHAIVSRAVVRLAYQARGRTEATTRDVEPLGVAYYSAAWYLVGWCRLRRDFRHFKLDRIHALEATAERFDPRPDFSLEAHLASNVAVEKLVPASAWFSVVGAERFRRECSQHPFEQRLVEDGIVVSLLTFSYEWLAKWLLSFGDEAEALDPPELRHMMADLAQRVAQRHADVAARVSVSLVAHS